MRSLLCKNCLIFIFFEIVQGEKKPVINLSVKITNLYFNVHLGLTVLVLKTLCNFSVLLANANTDLHYISINSHNKYANNYKISLCSRNYRIKVLSATYEFISFITRWCQNIVFTEENKMLNMRFALSLVTEWLRRNPNYNSVNCVKSFFVMCECVLALATLKAQNVSRYIFFSRRVVLFIPRRILVFIIIYTDYVYIRMSYHAWQNNTSRNVDSEG